MKDQLGDGNVPDVDIGTGYKRKSVNLDWAFRKGEYPIGEQVRITQSEAERMGWRVGFHDAGKRSDMDDLRPKLGSFELRSAWEKGFKKGLRLKHPPKKKGVTLDPPE